MNILLGVIVGLVVLTMLVLVHEWGHFIAARKNGVTVKEFGIGFPPRAIGWIKKDGKWQKVGYKLIDDGVVIEHELNYCAPMFLKIK